MAGGFGFQKYPQRGTPSSEAIGMALMQQGMAQSVQQDANAGIAPSAAPFGSMAGPSVTQPGVAMPLAPEAAAQRLDGARRMGAPGQIDDSVPVEDGHSLNAINIAVGEALTRMGGGNAVATNPYKDRARSIRNLQQLGLSSTEAELLAETGGI